MNSDSTLMARRAIEALRAGVPNRDAVRQLPVFQGDVTQKFTETLWEMQESATDDVSPRSMILSGGFGTGKSHVLEYLRHVAIEQRFVCSHIVISKETPLFDPLKMVRAAAETAAISETAGRAIPEILFGEKFNPERFAMLFKWVCEDSAVGDRIAPLLKIIDEHPAGAEEFLDEIAWEWSGYPMKVSAIRSALKEIGRQHDYRVRTIPQRELGIHLWRFLPKLFRAAGYNGWVVLIDEVELMLRYSKLQRAKSYAQVARIAGVTKDFKVSGLLPVFSITDDFWTAADSEKRDSEIPEWLRERGRSGDVELARDAEAGMKLLKRSKSLRSAKREEFAELKERVRELHSRAFGWKAPPARERETLASRSIREHVKSWIAEWDMMLLYPDYRSHIVVDEVVPDYSEDSDLSKEEDIFNSE
ncbi:MAG: BREX system ATP-binding domain-containing protein [Armatimonadota bacterium]